MNVPMQVNISSSLIDRWAMDVLPGRFSTSLAPPAPKGNPTPQPGALDQYRKQSDQLQRGCDCL
jgi:hypothetical protein